MSYKQIKWMILIVPTVTIWLWEFIRHEFHIPFLSMELGNWLAPLIVLGVTMAISLPLFRMLESIQRQLNEANAIRSAMDERERIARELHDGIAQSLFLLSVKVDKLESEPGSAAAASIETIRKTVHQVNGYVRQAIASLRYPPGTGTLPWTDMLQRLFESAENDSGLTVRTDWRLPEQRLTPRDKVELYACLREALINVQKHSGGRNVWIESAPAGANGWICRVSDDGDWPAQPASGGYGLQIVKERAREMGWSFELGRNAGRTEFVIEKR
ncbi:sensor histidine kinase [Paenibacillus alkalitolerans]|uniref:sensor histidine kinase n=1 Tax=Paenibacillus alkalitolerans TaxID=2799335 RepID=UPI0018F357BA|nr:histidine kinase [Paenibacillus alkalitolerans]